MNWIGGGVLIVSFAAWRKVGKPPFVDSQIQQPIGQLEGMVCCDEVQELSWFLSSEIKRSWQVICLSDFQSRHTPATAFD
jgi:hypothetical protein